MGPAGCWLHPGVAAGDTVSQRDGRVRAVAHVGSACGAAATACAGGKALSYSASGTATMGLRASLTYGA
jgi:hypothetical protein